MKNSLLILYVIFPLTWGISACSSDVTAQSVKIESQTSIERNLPIASSTPTRSSTSTPTSTMTFTPEPLPTETPKPSNTPTPTQTATPNLTVVPITVDELADWLSHAWRKQIQLGDIIPILEQGNWTSTGEVTPHHLPETYPYWQSLDLTGDGIDEWIISVFSDKPSVCCCRGYEFHGQLWVINQDGVVYQLSSDSNIWSVPFVVQTVDLTGDGNLDIVTQSINCAGAHTKTGIYHVISSHHGLVQNIVYPENELMQAAANLRSRVWDLNEDWSTNGIEVVSPDREFIQRTDSSQNPSLVIEGGWYGSAGAGPHRAFTETWAWDGDSLVLTDIQSKGGVFRTDVLFDANFAFFLGNLDVARENYERVVFDEELSSTAVMNEEMETYDDSRQFAAFRLVLLNLQTDNLEEAINWRNWLQKEYSSTPLTKATALLIDTWQETNDLAFSCAKVTSLLSSHRQATGVLIDTGYANPSITYKDVCISE